MALFNKINTFFSISICTVVLFHILANNIFFVVPRYVRVNTLVCKSVDQVCDQFAQEGWIKVKLPKKSSYQDFIARVKCLDESEFLVDFHLDYLLVFPPNTQFHDHDLLKNGSILLQDKVSVDLL